MERIKLILEAIDSTRSKLRVAMACENLESQKDLLAQLSNLHRMIEDMEREKLGQDLSALEYANLCM